MSGEPRPGTDPGPRSGTRMEWCRDPGEDQGPEDESGHPESRTEVPLPSVKDG